MVANVLVEYFCRIRALVFHQVPFVCGNDDPAARLLGSSCDRAILIGRPHRGVKHEDHDIGALDGAFREKDAD
ncbi:hypothetical protein D3C83_101570 [compost metagenome]